MEPASQIPNAPGTPGILARNSMLIKGLIVAAIILLMLIPMFYIQSLVKERMARKDAVISEVSSKWADAQTITGPVIRIPFKTYTNQGGNKVPEQKQYAYFLPDDLYIKGQITPEMRHRSIYSVPLYSSGIKITGQFAQPDFTRLNIDANNVLWNEAMLIVGLNDSRGFDSAIKLNWNNASSLMENAVEGDNVINNGVGIPVSFNKEGSNLFELSLRVKGSQQLYFTPVGKTTNVSLHSNWKYPSFDGNFLPVSADITNKGFSADWKVLQTARNYPPAFVAGKVNLEQSAFGVRLVDPADYYTKADRSVKYALLFITLTFCVFFLIELLQKIQIHPFQYVLVGIALCIFYTLLLSFSEYIGFNLSYGIAAVATITLIGVYVWSIFRRGRVAMAFIFGLTCLYAYIFFLIQLEDYSLLFGSIVLFLIVAAIMIITRKINWYTVSTNSRK